MKLSILFAAAALTAAFAHADAIEGKWRTVDDETGKPKAVVEISGKGGVYSGTIISLEKGVENVCPSCPNKRALIGMTVLTGLKADGENTYSGGEIFSPKNGKTYRAKAKVNASSLEVRGFVGVSAFGRTQKWQRVE